MVPRVAPDKAGPAKRASESLSTHSMVISTMDATGAVNFNNEVLSSDSCHIAAIESAGGTACKCLYIAVEVFAISTELEGFENPDVCETQSIIDSVNVPAAVATKYMSTALIRLQRAKWPDAVVEVANIPTTPDTKSSGENETSDIAELTLKRQVRVSIFSDFQMGGSPPI